MQTLAFYDMVASAFAEIIKNSDTSSQEAYTASLEHAKQKVIDMICQFRDIDPILSPILHSDEESVLETRIPDMIKSIAKRADSRKELGVVYTGTCFSKVIQRQDLHFPKYVDFSAKPHILVEPYKDQGWEEFAVKVMNQIILGSLLSLPKGNVRINFINPSLSNKSATISNNLPTDIWRIFIEEKEIKEFTESLANRIKETLRNGKKSEVPAYEVVVLLDYPYKFDNLTEGMHLLIEQGKQAGIHFIVLNDLRRSFEHEQSFDILSLKENYFQEFGAFNIAKKEDYDYILFWTYQICEQPALLQACFEYLNSDFKVETTHEEVVSTDLEYKIADNGLNVPIGKPIDKKTMEFSLGQDGHVHSFIIGQSGSGKSVLLHDIILEAIKKYSPEDLQLYLLDCKLGGVEFNRYKDVKHARALLVDNSDIQVILEILRDLKEQMQERGKVLRESGVQNIGDYNGSHPNERMSRIWVVIDECHVLFEQHSNSERKAKTEIVDIITKVATEGRSQGVHLIMATQTLANADIPTAILNNITDRYILNCAPIDAEKMWPNSSKLTVNLGVGDALYHNTMGRFPDTQFHAFYLTKEDAEIQITAAVAKAYGHQSNGQFYFNGSQIFQFNQEIIETVGKVRKDNLKACIGKSISLNQVPVTLTLKQDMSENILLTGIDEKGQSIRTAMNLLFSLVASNLQAGLNYKFYILNFRDDDDADYQDVIDQLEDSGLIDVVRKREVGSLLKRLVDRINNENIEPTILVILGQQRFRELKLDAEIISKPQSNDAFGPMNFDFSSQSSGATIKTYKDALNYILDNGPDYHVHTILQVDKPDNLLFEDYVTSKFVLKKFRNLVMLHSDEKAAMKLGIPDEIRLETLNTEPERLRAIYYADGDEGWELFSPFAMPNKDIISSITNKE